MFRLTCCVDQFCRNLINTWFYVYIYIHRGGDKSLAQAGKKQVTATKLKLLQDTQRKKIRSLSVQPGLRGSNYLRVGRKMATFQLFFSVGSG